MILNPIKAVLRLTADAAEALLYLIDFSDPADRLWNEACERLLVEHEAEHEVFESSTVAPKVSADSAAVDRTGASVNPRDVEAPVLPNFSAGELFTIARVLDIYAENIWEPCIREPFLSLAERLRTSVHALQ